MMILMETLCCKVLKRQRISSDHVAQCVNEQIGAAPPIEPELHFFEVGGKMFRGDLMPRAQNTALQERERGFDSVRGNVSIDVDLGGVVDSFVLFFAMSSQLDCVWVGRKVVSHDDFYILAHVLFDVLRQGSFLCILSAKESEIAVALLDPDYAFFVISTALELSAFPFSADIGFIHLDRAVEHRLFRRRHCRPNPMAQIPRRLVRALVLAPEGPLELHGAHALLCLAEQQDGKKPHRQGQVGIMEDRSAHHRKLVFATDTLEAGVILHSRHAAILAARTRHTFGPAEPFKQFAALFIGRKHRIDFRERHAYTS